MASKKILFIEDENEIIGLMRTRLEASGYQMFSACDGEEGLRKVKVQRPNLILLDIIMPKIDGLAVCRQLKGDLRTRNIPIIIVSACGDKDLFENCQQAGADEVVIKPFEAEELLDKISKLLDK